MQAALRSEGDDWLFAGDVKYHLGTSQVGVDFLLEAIGILVVVLTTFCFFFAVGWFLNKNIQKYMFFWGWVLLKIPENT